MALFCIQLIFNHRFCENAWLGNAIKNFEKMRTRIYRGLIRENEITAPSQQEPKTPLPCTLYLQLYSLSLPGM